MEITKHPNNGRDLYIYVLEDYPYVLWITDNSNTKKRLLIQLYYKGDECRAMGQPIMSCIQSIDIDCDIVQYIHNHITSFVEAIIGGILENHNWITGFMYPPDYIRKNEDYFPNGKPRKISKKRIVPFPSIGKDS